MRSVEELLQTFNFVNNPGARRFTVRFGAALALVAVFAIAAAMILARPSVPGGDGAMQYGATQGDPFAVQAADTPDGAYVGYPTALYDADQRGRYSADAILAAVSAWKVDNPDAVVTATIPVKADDGTLLGYRLVIQDGPLGR